MEQSHPDVSARLVWVGPGQIKYSSHVQEELVIRSLFSCVGVAAYDPVKKLGGLLHAMLPSSSFDAARAADCPGLFVDTGVCLLLQQMIEQGAVKERIVIKVGGGADIAMENPMLNLGERNGGAVRDILRGEGLLVAGQALGGCWARSLRLNIETGEVVIENSEDEVTLL